MPSVTHSFVSTKADGADATIVRPSNWNDVHTLSDVAPLASPTFTGTVTFPDGSTWTVTGPAIISPTSIAVGVDTTDVTPLLITQTWNNGATFFNGVQIAITDTASANGSYAFQVLGTSAGNVILFAVDKGGTLYAGAGINVPSTGNILFSGRTFIMAPGAGQFFITGNAVSGLLFTQSNIDLPKGSADAVGYSIDFKKSRGTQVAPTVITTGDDLGTLDFFGYVGVNNTWQSACRIVADSTGTISDSATGIAGITRFLAAKTGAEPAEIVQVNGTDQHLLHVGAEPSITAGGGTDPSIDGTDEAFTVTVGSGGLATSVEVTFANAFAVAPRCCANHQGAILVLRCVSTVTKVTIDAATPFTAGGLIDVICRSGTT